MTESIRTYYRFLVKNFANVSLTGCHDMAVLLAMYDPDKLLKDAFEKAAEYTERTATAIEKSCRLYLKTIAKDYTIEDMSKFFDYAFKADVDDALTLAEFIPIVKLYLDSQDNEAI